MIFDGRYLKGAVKISVRGAMPERFINLCMAEKIELWAITRDEDGLVAWISLRNFFKIRALARKSKTQVKALTFFGLPFTVKKIKNRKMLAAGFVFFVAALYVLSLHIWFVEIKGLKSVSENEIRQIAALNGLKRAALIDKADVKQIEQEILLNIPEISWVGVSFNGTEAIIEVVEKTMPREENKAPADMVSQKEGVVEEIIVFSGQAAVQKGDVVKKGDVLIWGVEFNPLVPGDTTVTEKFVRAKGIVRAKVWYEGIAEINRVKIVSAPTGSKEVAITLTVGEKEVMIKPLKKIPFEEYEVKTVRKRFAPWRNSRFNVELTIDNYLEIITRQEEIPYEAALETAKRKALNSAQSNIAPSAQILSRGLETVSNASENIVIVRVNVNTIEDIGETKDN